MRPRRMRLGYQTKPKETGRKSYASMRPRRMRLGYPLKIGESNGFFSTLQ